MEEKLRKLMKFEGINSTKLAEILGIQASGISHIMSGRNKPSFDFLVKLLQHFPQINPDWLLLDKGPMYRDEVKKKNSPSLTPAIPTIAPAELFDTTKDSIAQASSPEEEKDIIPADTDKQSPTNEFPQQTGDRNRDNDSQIEKIVIFYSDHTFSSYRPE